MRTPVYRRVLVTGGTGFIGSHLLRHLLLEGCEPIVLSRSSDVSRIRDLESQVSLLRADLCAPNRWEAEVIRARPELCLHLAWEARPGRYLHEASNVDFLSGSLRLVRALGDAGCRRIVSVGTCLEYEPASEPVAEDRPIRPQSLYAACKAALSHILDPLARSLGMTSAWARLFYQFGPDEDPGRLVPSVIGPLLRGEEVEVTAGEQIRDFLYVEDVASALWAIAASGLEGPVNIGSGQPTPLRELLLQLGEILGGSQRIRFGSLPYRPGELMYLCAATERLRTGTGWAPAWTLEAGLRTTAAWWRRRLRLEEPG